MINVLWNKKFLKHMLREKLIFGLLFDSARNFKIMPKIFTSIIYILNRNTDHVDFKKTDEKIPFIFIVKKMVWLLSSGQNRHG